MIRRRCIIQDIDQLLPELRTRLEERDAVLFSYLLGSEGRGNPGALCDVDTVVFFDPARAENLWGLKVRLIDVVMGTLKTDEVDLVILNEADVALRYHVLGSKRLLLSRDERQRIAFVDRTVQSYPGSEPLRQRSWDALSQVGS